MGRAGLPRSGQGREGVITVMALTVMNTPASCRLDLQIVVPVEDMTDISALIGAATDDGSRDRERSIWPHVEACILDSGTSSMEGPNT